MKAIYESLDCGTERVVRLVDAAGRDVVSPRDPFWPTGIPASDAAQRRRINQTARAMAQEARERGLGQ